MVRKISAVLCSLVLICALCTTAQATTHEVYENGTISTTYLEYFKDIISGFPIDTKYIAFRSGQNSYSLIVPQNYSFSGDGTVTGSGLIHEYKFYTDSTTGYNQNYKYNKNEYLQSFELKVDDDIIYTNMISGYPRLVDERGESIEYLQTLVIIVAFFMYVISRFFLSGSRRGR